MSVSPTGYGLAIRGETCPQGDLAFSRRPPCDRMAFPIVQEDRGIEISSPRRGGDKEKAAVKIQAKRKRG